jgi:phospholipid-translocating ATPase
MMEQMYVMIYNFMFTAAPPLAVGAFEKRLHEDILIKNPRLYRYVSKLPLPILALNAD